MRSLRSLDRKAAPEGKYVFAGNDGRPVNKDMARRWLEDAVAGSSLEHIGFQTLRHSFASNLAAAGVDDRIIDHFMGHQTVEMRKGKKDRMVPIGERALGWIGKYLHEARPSLSAEPDLGVLFLTGQGEPFTPNRLTQLVRDYVDRADVGKRGACHLFRHTMATLMLEGGADIRFIHQMLGHARLDTTQIYTQVSIRKLKEIHEMTHPARMGATLGEEVRRELEEEMEEE